MHVFLYSHFAGLVPSSAVNIHPFSSVQLVASGAAWSHKPFLIHETVSTLQGSLQVVAEFVGHAAGVADFSHVFVLSS